MGEMLMGEEGFNPIHLPVHIENTIPGGISADEIRNLVLCDSGKSDLAEGIPLTAFYS